MDDGQRVDKGGITLCTDSFDSEGISTLRLLLKSNFNMITSIHKKDGSNGARYERIYIFKKSLDENKELLIPNMHPSMLYKINADIPLDDPNLVSTDQSNDQPKTFKQNSKDLLDTSEDNILSNFFEDI